VLRVSAKPTVCGRWGDIPPARTAALLPNPRSEAEGAHWHMELARLFSS